jgi:hypothetical protein
VQESDVESFGALARRFVDQLHALAGQLVEISLQTRGGNRQMLDAFTLLLDEFADRAFRIGRFEQFNLGLPDLEKSGAHFLFLDFFDRVTLQTQLVFPEFDGFVEVFDSDADVFDM